MKAAITKQMLVDANACSEQVEAFARLFGDSVNVTVAKARKVAHVFDWGFATRIQGPAWAQAYIDTCKRRAGQEASK